MKSLAQIIEETPDKVLTLGAAVKITGLGYKNAFWKINEGEMITNPGVSKYGTRKMISAKKLYDLLHK
jgi:hypothetical protein